MFCVVEMIVFIFLEIVIIGFLLVLDKVYVCGERFFELVVLMCEICFLGGEFSVCVYDIFGFYID